jgi:2,3-bisphosphoglycerate-dependent phosphoglycerate mutase
LQGLDEAETADRYGNEPVLAWRRSRDVRPPLLDVDDKRHPVNDGRYAGLPAALLPDRKA